MGMRIGRSPFYFAIVWSLLLTGLKEATGATQTLADLYKNQTFQLLSQMDKKGLSEIACESGNGHCISTNDLRSQLETVSFYELKGFIKPTSATRHSAFYSPKSRIIYLNTEVNHPPEFAGYIGLHELLGVMGIAENEFQITRAIYFWISEFPLTPSREQALRSILRSPPPSFPAHSVNETAREIKISNNQLESSSGGGVTVVGGAGDGELFQQWILFYKYLFASGYPKYDENLLDLHALAEPIFFEITDSPALSVTYLRPAFSMGAVQILLPRNLISTPPKYDRRAPNAALEDVAFFFNGYRGFFPQFKTVEMINYRSLQTGVRFFYPSRVSGIHPMAMEFYFRPLWRMNCAPAGCEAETNEP